MRTKVLLLLAVSSVLLLAGCASKGYVNTKMAEMQAKVDADVNTVKAQTTMNADDIRRIQAVTDTLSRKTDMALNQAKGFEDYTVIWEGTINFAFDSYDLSQADKDNIEDLGKKMIDNPRSILELSGFTDRVGSAKYNFDLGMKRAESVKAYITEKFGVPIFRMYTVSYGKTKPIAMPDEANANAKNRRVTLKLWGPPQLAAQ